MVKQITVESEIFTRGVEDIITSEELRKHLSHNKQLRIKLGIDATSPDLHIGHAVNLWKIRALQEIGHKAVIILGSFTTRIGDPTGKSATRPTLKREVIRKNARSLEKQIRGILLTSPGVYELRDNAEWFGKMRAQELLSLASLVTHSRLIGRDMFQERIKQRKEIVVSEMLYPILQGYDSVAVKSDLTIIGSDQLFNEHMGRFFQEKFHQQPQAIVTHRILPGLYGGEKMSKSLGNYIALGDPAKDKFGKAMSISDSLIVPYAELYTTIPMKEIEEMGRGLTKGKNPMEAKAKFAEALVSRYHGVKAARRERDLFYKVFSEGALPDDIPGKKIRAGVWNVVELLMASGLAASKSEARRLIKQRGVTMDGSLLVPEEKEVGVKEGAVLRVGKRRCVKIM